MYNIAIDGPVGSGKSTLAKMLATRLGFRFLDTGALYRGVACYIKYKNIDKIDEQSINKIVNELTIKIKFINNIQHVIINNLDFTAQLREEDISMLSSQISNYKSVRDKVLLLQREFAKENNCILEGRDIGTVILPNADVKFYLIADEKIRATRRYLQSVSSENISYEEIFNDLKKRDFDNMHREIAPLKPAQDSIIIDNTNMTIEECANLCMKYINKNKPFKD